jgi:hypothetical protein
MTVIDKPDLDEDLLIHYGVAGMKWGKTRARGKSADIKKARGNVAKRAEKYKAEKNKLKAMKDGKAKVQKMKDLNKMKVSNLKDPDRVLANRLTRGEKAAVLGFSFITLTLPVGLGVVAGTSAASRRIEYKQGTQAYQVKK